MLHKNSQTFLIHHFLHPLPITILTLLLLSVTLVCPLSPTSSHAAIPAPLADTATSLSVALDSSIIIDTSPSPNHHFAANSGRLQISTNHPTGYSVWATTINPTSALTTTNPHPTATSQISSLNVDALPSDFPANTWGIALTNDAPNQNTLYHSAAATTTTPLYQTSTSGDASYQLTVGTSIDYHLAPSSYSANLLISVAPNPLEITQLSDLVFMQDMTSNICANTLSTTGATTITPGNEPTKRLTDVRDGKEYWVTKLADGNCWMTQNLALSLQAGQTLSNSDTDLNSQTSWLVPQSTIRSLPMSTDDTSNFHSWHLGNYVFALADAEEDAWCLPSDPDTPFISLQPSESFTRCSAFQDVAGWQPTLIAGPGTWRNKSYDFVAADSINQTYDAHYLIGNYYAWGTATAGSGIGLVSTWNDISKQLVAPDSICPKGWQLPRGGRSSDAQPYDFEDSFYRLYRAYGYPNSGYTQAYSGTPMLYGISQNPFEYPMSIVAAGVIEPQNTGLHAAGQLARYWTGTAGTSYAGTNTAYTLNVVNGTVTLNHTLKNTLGQSVRCLAK